MGCDSDNRKEKFVEWSHNNYVPIYSKPWYMDILCGPDNWDVWLYEKDGSIDAVMPYYFEKRGNYDYITKPPIPLSQNNGIIFREDNERKIVGEAKFQQRIIDEACEFIKSLGVDVYEQQYQTTFTNWLPFYWHGYTSILRYTYVIEDTSDLDKVLDNMTSNYRKNIKKGQRLTHISEEISNSSFYNEHMKVFLRQDKQLPFTESFWDKYVTECEKHNSGKKLIALDEAGNICAVLFLIWDERRMYHICGGYMPEYASVQAYPALTFHAIELAHSMGLSYDFEGSVIKNINEAIRQFGGRPVPYYRIRKVFNPEVVRKEAEDYIENVLKL